MYVGTFFVNLSTQPPYFSDNYKIGRILKSLLKC